MQTVLLEISDDVKDTVLSFLRMLPSRVGWVALFATQQNNE